MSKKMLSKFGAPMRESKSSLLNFLLKTLFSLLIFLSFSFIAHSSVYAATYYVDQTEGNDTRDGLSQTNSGSTGPWKTISKVNASTFLPDDSVLFKRGETWMEQLIVPSSGTANHPIVFADYGSGALPIITGAGSSNGALLAYAKSYLIIQNLDVNATGANYGVILSQVTDVLVTGCTVRNSKTYDGLYINGGAADTRDITVENCITHNNKKWANIGVAGNDPNLDGPANIIIRNNTVYANGENGGDHGIYLRFGVGGQVYGNTIYSNKGNGITLRSWQGATIYGNTIYGNNNGIGLAILTSDAVDTKDNIIYNNVFYDNLTSNVATQMFTKPMANYFYFNTFVTARTNEFQPDSSLVGFVFKNNIFYHDETTYPGKYLYNAYANSLVGNIFNWNCLYITSGTNIVQQNSAIYTFSTWKALHGFPLSGNPIVDQPDGNSINADPAFVQANDISNLNTFAHLQPTSPCRGVGVAIPGITTDKNGVTRTDPPTIGAYEYVPPEYVPLTVTVEQATGQPDPTSSSTINFTVVFSESVSDFTTGDVTLSGTAGATTGTVTRSDTTYNVAVTGMTESGTVIATLSAGVATGLTGNTNEVSTSTDNTVAYDIPPLVLISITINDNSGYTNSSTPTINIVSLKSPTHIAFSCNDGTNYSSWIAYADSISSFDITNGATGCNSTNGSKTITAKLKDGLGNESETASDTTFYDNTGPTGSISNGSGNPTNDTTPTLNLTIADSGIGASNAQMSFSCDGSSWSGWETYTSPKTDFNIKPGSPAYGCGTTDGSRTVYVQFRDSLQNTGSSYDTGSFTLETISPTVTINQAAGQADPASTSPINFTVVFSESVSDFTTGDVTLSGTAGATTATVTGSGTTYNVAVTGTARPGTVTASLASAVAHDAAGNNNEASTSSDNTVTTKKRLK